MPEADIYGLGATVVEYSEKLLSETERRATWQHWHQHLQTLLNRHKPQMAPMLADVADQRPMARQLVERFFPQSVHGSFQSPQNGIT
jgi:hypothetical protein